MSLFQVDIGHDWIEGPQQSLDVSKELQRKGLPFWFIVQLNSPLHRLAKEAKLPVIPIKTSKEAGFITALRLARRMKRYKCRLVHFFDSAGISAGILAASMAKVPIRIISQKAEISLKYIKDVDTLITNSLNAKKELISSGLHSAKIKVVPDGIDYSPYFQARASDFIRQEFSFADDDFLVGILANLGDPKSFSNLMRMTHVLKEKAPKIKVIILGEGPLHLNGSRLAKDVHADNTVFWHGFRDDIPGLFGSLDAFAISSFLEGMSRSIMDALASRLPVVVPDVQGIPKDIIHGKTGLLVSPRGYAATAKAILRIYFDKELRTKIGEKAFETMFQKYSAEAMASLVVKEYERLADKKNMSLI